MHVNIMVVSYFKSNSNTFAGIFEIATIVTINNQIQKLYKPKKVI